MVQRVPSHEVTAGIASAEQHRPVQGLLQLTRAGGCTGAGDTLVPPHPGLAGTGLGMADEQSPPDAHGQGSHTSLGGLFLNLACLGHAFCSFCLLYPDWSV